MSLCATVERRPSGTRLIVGGQGAIPFLAYRDLVHRVHFGRCEGVAKDAIYGEHATPHTWDCSDAGSANTRRRTQQY